jgi:branched-subunit amino acid ABC-type transport system permease component
MFGQLILEGLAIGACYAVFGIAVVIIYKTSEVINFAQGEMAMLSTFVAYHILTVYGWPFWSAFLLTMLFSVLLGVFIEFAFLRPRRIRVFWCSAPGPPDTSLFFTQPPFLVSQPRLPEHLVG